MIEFGDKLKKLRIDKGYNQTELAHRLGVNKSIISAYENQQRLPSIDVLIKISYEFNISLEWLVGIKKFKTIDVSKLTDEQIIAIANIVSQFEKANK